MLPKLVYYEAYQSKKDANLRERKLKQRGQAIRRLKERIFHSIAECSEGALEGETSDWGEVVTR